MVIERVVEVWNDLESAYAEYIKSGGDLARLEYLKSIAFIKDGKYAQSLLTAILGQEVATYDVEQHEKMQEVLELSNRVAMVLLQNPGFNVTNLNEAVDLILEHSISNTDAENVHIYTAADAAIIKQRDYTTLEDAINLGIFCTSSFVDNDGKLCTIRLNNTTGNYLHIANKNDAKLFCFLKEAGAYPALDFYDRVYNDLQCNDYKGNVIFVDSSLYTKSDNKVKFFSTEIEVAESGDRFIGTFQGKLANCDFVCFE